MSFLKLALGMACFIVICQSKAYKKQPNGLYISYHACIYLYVNIYILRIRQYLLGDRKI